MATSTAQPTWREQQHAIQVRGSTHVTIHDCTFVNLSGDGVLFYEASISVRIHHCTFRGQNTNRNGVSITNAQVCRITDCTFEGMTRPDMPGPIDLEPDVAARTRLRYPHRPQRDRRHRPASPGGHQHLQRHRQCHHRQHHHRAEPDHEQLSAGDLGGGRLVRAASRTSSSGTTTSVTSRPRSRFRSRTRRQRSPSTSSNPPPVVPEDRTDKEPQRRRRMITGDSVGAGVMRVSSAHDEIPGIRAIVSNEISVSHQPAMQHPVQDRGSDREKGARTIGGPKG